jgi:hypothetical protein
MKIEVRLRSHALFSTKFFRKRFQAWPESTWLCSSWSTNGVPGDQSAGTAIQEHQHLLEGDFWGVRENSPVRFARLLASCHSQAGVQWLFS